MIDLKARRKLRVLEGLYGGERVSENMKPVLTPDSAVDQADASITGTLAWHIADANGSARTVTIYTSNYKVLDNTIVPKTMSLEVKNGAVFNISVGKTLTILGELEAGRYQIFSLSGGGVVEGLSVSYPEWFGAAADAVTDDRDCFNAAFESLSSMGGKVFLDTKKQYYIASNITMPKYTALVGNSSYSMLPREGSEWEDAGNLIYLAGTASIKVSEGGAILGFNIIRYGMTLPADAAEVTSFTGTAIRLEDHAHQVYIGHMGIIGFGWAIDNYNSGGVTDSASFNYCENLKVEYCVFDNKNNIRIGTVLSTTFINNVKTGAIATLGLGGVTDTDYERIGYSFHFCGETDGVLVSSCTSWGYQNAFRVEHAHALSFTNCSVDHPSTPVLNTPVAFAIVSDSSETTKITSCHMWGGTSIGVYVDNVVGGAFSDTVIVTGCHITCTNHNIHVIDGNVVVNGNVIRGGTSGIALEAGADIVKVDGNIFHDVDYVINADASFADANLLYGENFYDTVNTAFANNWAIPAVASSGTIAIPLGHKLVSITGTTGITSITATYPEHRVSLLFAASLTVTDGSNLKLGGNFSATADDILTLVCDGTNWYQEGNN